MIHDFRILAVTCSAALLLGLAGCGSDAEAISVDNKEGCIVEVSKRLLTCAEDRDCEEGVSRYAGYCYNTAPGDQLDICRGGQYFFQQPIGELLADNPEIGQLNGRQKSILIRTGEVYCNFNYN